MYKISSQSASPFESYRVNGRTDTLTGSRVYSLFEYTKSISSIMLVPTLIFADYTPGESYARKHFKNN